MGSSLEDHHLHPIPSTPFIANLSLPFGLISELSIVSKLSVIVPADLALYNREDHPTDVQLSWNF